MKNFLNGVIKGLGIGSGILLVLFVGFYFVKATWTNVSPGTTDSNLFVSGSGTLTKAKRNSMVENLNGSWINAKSTWSNQLVGWTFGRTGFYKKIGSTVCVNLELYGAAKAVSWGGIVVKGLPLPKVDFDLIGYTHNGAGSVASAAFVVKANGDLEYYGITTNIQAIIVEGCYESAN